MKENFNRHVIPVEHWISIEGPIMIRFAPANRSPLPHDCGYLTREARPLQLDALEREGDVDRVALFK